MTGMDGMNDTAVRPDADVFEVEGYRLLARAWLAENLQRRTGPAQSHEVGHYTPDVMASSRALQRTLFEGGYAGISWPREYGGQGLPLRYERIFLEEAAAYEMPDFGVLTATTFYICVPTMLAHASPEFLCRFIPQVLSGQALVCQFFSEPSSGSDLAGVRTRATKDGEGWILNGQKIWSTFAHLADWGMCLARTDWDVPKHRGLTWFAVPCRSPGLTIRPIKQITESAEFCEEFFDDVAVLDTDRVGNVNEGWGVAQTMLVFERGAGRPDTGTTAASPGPIAPDLVRMAQRSGRVSDPIVRQKLARAHTNDFVGRTLASRIQEMGRLGRLGPGMAAYGKLFRGTYQPIRARIGIEIGGNAALTWDDTDAAGAEASMAYLNGRAASIAGGTNEMQRNAIAERALGLPREPSFDTKMPFSEVLRQTANWADNL
jgi:alkylation response protein AidB-like acyl-CoA dehydrogenase